MLRLKRSKIDVDHSKIQIILATINEKTCFIMTLCHLFHMNSQLINFFFFRLIDDIEIFIKVAIIKKLKKRLIEKNINAKSYTRHNFRKKTTQHVSNNEMLDENIQRLSRWTFNAFQLYFKTSMTTRFNLNLNF